MKPDGNNVTPQSTVPQRLKQLRKQAGLSRREVGLAVGLKPTGVQHYEEPGRFKDDALPPEFLPIVQMFTSRGVPEKEVRALFNPLLTSDHQPEQARSNVRRVEVATPQPDENLPVYGSAQGGPDGRFEFQGEALDYVRRPALLANVENAYAVQMVGDSMSPRYEEGELLYVHPGRLITRGCYVVVQVETGDAAPAAYVKQFIKFDGDRVVLRQLHPAGEFVLGRDRVRSMHRVVQSGER